MNLKLIFFCVLTIACARHSIKAQINNVADKKYSVIIPDGFQDKGNSYPLIVCYQNEITDSLFQGFANNTQTIILQLDHAPDTTLSSESLKRIILKTKYDFNVASDKIYLLGANHATFPAGDDAEI